MAVRTASTFAPSSFSTARLMSTFVAPVATSNTSVRPPSRSSVVFSVISGRRITSVCFITCRFPVNSRCPAPNSHAPLLGSWKLDDWELPASVERRLQFLEGVASHDHHVRVRHLAPGDAPPPPDRPPADLAPRQP